MKKFYGNYLGLCINNDDPQKRGRVQVFIPHVMPALYKDWNASGNDIEIQCVGNNLPSSIPAPIIEKLKKILPWSEAALPVMGTSAPGSLINNNYDQSPVSNPDCASGTSPYASGGAVFTGRNSENAAGGTNGNWGGSLNYISNIVPAGTYNVTAQKESGGHAVDSMHNLSSLNAYAVDLGVNTTFGGDKSRAEQTALQTVNNVQIQNGRQTYSSWSQVPTSNGIWTDESNGFKTQVIWNGPGHYDHVHVGTRNTGSGNNNGQTASVANNQTSSVNSAGCYEGTSTSAQVIPNPLSSPNPIDDRASVAVPTVGNTGGALTKLATDRQSYFANEINDPVILQRLTYLASREVGADINQQTAFIETVVNRAYFGRTSLTSVLNNIGYFENDSGVRSQQISTATQTAFNNVMKGSNLTNLATDNASNDYKNNNPVADRRIRAGVTGGWLKNGMPSNPNYGEFFYRGNGSDGYSYKAGLNADAYAASNGIEGVPNRDNLVMNPDPHGPSAVLNINDMAAGMFSYPAAGSQLWIFFREGNPLFPVYFGASYGEREWASAYRLGSDGVGYKPAATADNPAVSTGGTWNMSKAGAIHFFSTTDPTNPLNNERTMMLAGGDGSNITFAEGYHQILSKFDRRDQVEGDRWQTTLGYKEEWIQGNSNSNTFGDVIIRVGNTSQQAANAVDDIINNIKGVMNTFKASKTKDKGYGFGANPSKYAKAAIKRYEEGPLNAYLKTIKDFPQELTRKQVLINSQTNSIQLSGFGFKYAGEPRGYIIPRGGEWVNNKGPIA